MLDRDYSPSNNYLRVGTLCGLVASGVTLFMTIKARFRNKYRVCCLITGFIISWIFTLVFVRDFASILAALITNVALGYILVIRPMVEQYIDLVNRHMTMKEYVARRQSSREQCIKDEFKTGTVPFKAAVKNQYRFFCKKKIPKSNRPFSPRHKPKIEFELM